LRFVFATRRAVVWCFNVEFNRAGWRGMQKKEMAEASCLACKPVSSFNSLIQVFY
jgi:hypothetical protein